MDIATIKQQARKLSTPLINQGYEPQGLHHYVDETGLWLYSKIRLCHPQKGKIIRPICEKNGQFIIGEPKFNGKKPLYGLPLIRASDMIFWVEGEKKVDALIKLGLVATTSGGATSHDNAELSPLQGKKIIVWADSDEAGKNHARAIKVALEKLTCDVSMIDVDSLELPQKGDVVDWLKLNPSATQQDILALPHLPKEIKPEYGVILLKASELRPKPINWIWNGWVADGKFHLLGGVAGTGKTTIALALAASITNGGIFPDGSTAASGNVVIWTGEDDISDTLTPRLMAMGAQLERVHFVQGVLTENGHAPFDPGSDMPILKEAILKIGNVRLLIIDPIVSVVNGDSHKNAEVRKDLAPLIQMAEATRFAIIGITHFSKGTTGREPIERITGSLAFGAVARIVLVASRSKSDDGDDIRIFLRAKSNIGSDDGGYEYSFEQTTTHCGIETSKIIWGGKIEGAAKELLGDAENDADGGCLSDCIRFLSCLLDGRDVSSNEIAKECKGAGYSTSTVNRAKKKMGIEAYRTGMGKGGYWACKLPKIFKESIDSQF